MLKTNFELAYTIHPTLLGW